MSSTREDLAVAIRRANLIYANASEPKPEIFGARWSELEAEVDAALAAGDDLRARHAIAGWCEHVVTQFGGVAR